MYLSIYIYITQQINILVSHENITAKAKVYFRKDFLKKKIIKFLHFTTFFPFWKELLSLMAQKIRSIYDLWHKFAACLLYKILVKWKTFQ